MSESTKIAGRRADEPAPALRRRRLGALLLTLGLTAGCTNLPGPSPLKATELSSSPLLGKFVWRDLMTDDPALVKPDVFAQIPKLEPSEGLKYGAGVAGALLVLALGRWFQSRKQPVAAPATDR